MSRATVVGLLLRRMYGTGETLRRHRDRRHHSLRGEKSAWSQGEIVLEANLVQRANDSQIRDSMQDLCAIIDQHCENYYHREILENIPDGVETNLTKCGYGLESISWQSTGAQFVALLMNPRTRFAAIRHLIATVIISNMDWRSDPKFTLLPSQIVAFCQTIPPVEDQPKSQEIFEKAFIQWRHLSAFLLEPFRSNREAPKPKMEDLQEAIQGNTRLINSVLGEFMKSNHGVHDNQKDSLEAIIFEGAQLGLLLFSQPSIWHFTWEPLSRKKERKNGKHGGYDTRGKIVEKSLVVFPGIEEISGETGEQPGRPVSDPVSVEL